MAAAAEAAIARINVLFVSSLLALSFAFTQPTPQPTDLINQTCKQTDYYNLCISSLARQGSVTDLDEFVEIFIDLAILNATDTYAYIAKLLKSTTDNGVRVALHECSVVYDTGLNHLRDAKLALGSKSYQDVNRLVGMAKDQGSKCEDLFKTPPQVRPSPLTQRNELFEQLCSVDQSIVNLVH